jgi:HK97 family phage major capsid protein
MNDIQPGSRQRRTFAIDRRAVDPGKRTVELSFSSETPIEHPWGIEVLSHDPGAVRLDRIRSAGPLLDGHDMTRQVGVVDRAAIGGGKGRATVRFSKSDQAEEVFQDVVDGIRTNVSVGYVIHAVQEDRSTSPPTFTVTDWEPYEISLVSAPADISVGVGRSFNSEAFMTASHYDQQDTTSSPSRSQRRAMSNEHERERATRLLKLGDDFSMVGDARRFIEEGRSVDDFMDFIVTQQGRTRAQPVNSINDPAYRGNYGGLSFNQRIFNQREAADYSILRGIRSLMDPRQGGCFEFEVSQDLDRQLGRKSRGFSVPITGLPWGTRGMSVGSDTKGGYLVDETLMTGDLIGALRAKSVVLMVGARSLDGLVGDVLIPRLDSGVAAGWIGEGGDAPEVDPQFGQLAMRPKTVAAYTDLTRKLLQQTGRAAESLIRSDFVAALGVELDRAALNGLGTSHEPLGVLNQAGINTATVATPGTPTWAEIVDFEGKVETDNALEGNLAYIAHPATKAKMKATQKASGTGFIWEGGRIGDYSAFSTANMPENGILFGNFSDLIIGTWGVLDIVVDNSTLSKSGGVRICAFLDVDIAVRHRESFCKNA